MGYTSINQHSWLLLVGLTAAIMFSRVAIASGNGFANADLSGNWFLCGSDLQENQTWDGNVVLSSTGAVTGGSLNGSDGSAYSLVGGSLSIDDTGRVTGTITDSDNATIQLTMHMDPAKGLIAGEGNSVGGTEDGVFVLVRKAQPIIGAWEFGDGQPDDSGVLIFLENGTYFHAEDTVGNATESDGMERGTYSWNDVTKVLSIQVQVDTNGEIGLSDAEGTLTATITGDSMIIGDNTGASTLTRVASATLPLVGAWHFGGDTAESGALVFLPNNVYFHAEDIVSAEFEFDGMERGTYSWNPASGLLTATPSVDTNGKIGLSHPAGPFTAKVVGDGLRIRDNSGTQPMNRVTHLPGTLSISGIGNGQVTIQFQGTLQSSSDLSNWADVSPSPTSPLTFNPGPGLQFYVSRGR